MSEPFDVSQAPFIAGYSSQAPFGIAAGAGFSPARCPVSPRDQAILISPLLQAFTSLASVFEAVMGGQATPPSFSKPGYPTIVGGTPSQVQQIWSYLSAIPAQDRSAVRRVSISDYYTTGAAMVTAPGPNGPDRVYGDIMLNSRDLEDPARAQYVVLHETGHAVAMQDGILNGNTAGAWNGPDVLGNPFADHPGEPINPASETFADAYAAYYGGNGQKLEQGAPVEYQALASGAYEAPPITPTRQQDFYGFLTRFAIEGPIHFGPLLNAIGGPQLAMAWYQYLAQIGFFEGELSPPGTRDL